jgi:hypothetical protein
VSFRAPIETIMALVNITCEILSDAIIEVYPGPEGSALQTRIWRGRWGYLDAFI